MRPDPSSLKCQIQVSADYRSQLNSPCRIPADRRQADTQIILKTLQLHIVNQQMIMIILATTKYAETAYRLHACLRV